MNISDYVFNVGDEVITYDGIRGKIVGLCECNYCKERGFHEPIWKDENGDEDFITDVEVKTGFKFYYKIGNYTFGNLSRAAVKRNLEHCEKSLAMYKRQLAVIEELEKEN